MGTSGFAEARDKRSVAVPIDLIKCLQRGVQLYVAGGETLLTRGASQTSQNLKASTCISAVYDAVTVKDITDAVTRGKPLWSSAPVDVSASDTEPAAASGAVQHCCRIAGSFGLPDQPGGGFPWVAGCPAQEMLAPLKHVAELEAGGHWRTGGSVVW